MQTGKLPCCFLTILTVQRGRHGGSSWGKSKQIRPYLKSKKHTCNCAKWKPKRTTLTPLCNNSHQQHCSIKLCYGISSPEELQNSVHQHHHHHSFLPISISCGLPTAASIQTCPHSRSRYCLFSGEKC